MNSLNSVYAMISIVAGVVLIALLYKFLKRTELEKRVYAIKDRKIMPNGLRLWYEAGTVKNDESIALGLERCFEKARCKGYTQALHPSCYTVAVVKGERVPGSDSKLRSIKLTTPRPYRGTVFDKDGFMYVTGEVLELVATYDNVIVISDQDKPYDIELAAHNETEHVVLAWNDLDEYHRTQIHTGLDNSHPIIPDCPA